MKESNESSRTPVERRCEIAAWILMGLALFFVLLFKMVSALIVGLLTHALLRALAGRIHGPRVSHGVSKVLSVLLVGLLAGGLVVGMVLLLVAVVRGQVGDFPTLLQKVADTIDLTRVRLKVWGMPDLVPEKYTDVSELESGLSSWFRTHGEAARKGAGAAGKFVLRAVIGMVVALLAFFRRHEEDGRPFARALSRRVALLADSFDRVLLAQTEIAAINTALTATYLYGVLGFLGSRLPMTGTLLVITFVAGLIPVAGNIISNTVIVLLSLGVSPWVALLSLVFLVTIHKLEYLLNAKIVGVRIKAAAWETLIALFVMEAAFGPRGIILAPVIYAYLKRELSEKELV